MNNAALFTALPRRESPWDIPYAEFDQVMAVNVRAIYRCTVECLPLMQRHQGGRVINIASGLAFKGSPGLMHYAASKGAVVNLTRSMAQALGHTGITVNAIAPGGTASPTLLAVQPHAGVGAIERRSIKRVEVLEDSSARSFTWPSPPLRGRRGASLTAPLPPPVNSSRARPLR